MASDFKNAPRIGQKYIQSTAGAVSKKTSKGEMVVEKVNVHRYIAGKRPEWAPEHSDEEEESEDEAEEEEEEEEQNDEDQIDVDDIKEEEDLDVIRRPDHGRRIVEPEVIATADDEEDEEEDDIEVHERQRPRHRIRERPEESDGEEEEDVLDEDAIERRRQLLKRRAQEVKAQEKDLLDIEEEEDEEEEEEDESSEYEEYSDSDDETGLRLKPVFVSKNDRVTIQDREKMYEENEMSEEKAKKLAEERKRVSTKLVNEILREEQKEQQGDEAAKEDELNTDDDNDEEEYEAWKVRELKRIKRDKEEKEQREKEEMEIRRRHDMTEEERREEWRKNPKMLTNKAQKGKYKFLQKYYHRGAFFMDQEQDVYTRDFSGATLEDHFDKTVLPKVMQVKNFGRSGRTKYTHLVDQDTTEMDSPWFNDTPQSLKFHAKHGGGNKQVFERPSKKNSR